MQSARQRTLKRMRRSRRGAGPLSSVLLAIIAAPLGIAALALPAASQSPTEQSPTGQATHRAPRLFTPDPFENFESIRIEGEDPAAPRALTLWRLGGAEPQKIAETRSRLGGQIDFGAIPLPASGLRLSVTPAGQSPAAGSGLWIEGHLPAPRVRVAAPAVAPHRIEVLPAVASGEIRILAADSGRLEFRAPIETGRAGSPGQGLHIDLDEALGTGTRPLRILIFQQRASGQRSPATEWTVED